MEAEPLLLALAVLTAPLVGCLASSETQPLSLETDRLAKGDDSAIEDRQTHVVREAEAWQQLWDQHAPEEDRPEVDFGERMVLAAFMGTSSDTCHEVRIDNVTERADAIEVTGRWLAIEAGFCAQQITHPYEIVTVAAHDKPVTFAMRNATADASGEGEDEGMRSEGSVDVETIAQGQGSEIADERHLVVRNQTAWTQAWRNHTGNDSASPPAVDFGDATVLAVFKGQSPNACHAVNVTDVRAEGEDATADVVYRTGDGMGCGMQVVHPYHIVTVPRVDGEVSFDVTRR